MSLKFKMLIKKILINVYRLHMKILCSKNVNCRILIRHFRNQDKHCFYDLNHSRLIVNITNTKQEKLFYEIGS